MKILIKGGRVVDPKNDFDKVADVLVDNGVISEIGENINADGDVQEVPQWAVSHQSLVCRIQSL